MRTLTKKENKAVEVLVEQFRTNLINDIINTEKRVLGKVSSIENLHRYATVISQYLYLDKDVMLSKATRETTQKNGRYFLYWICRQPNSDVRLSASKIGLECGGYDHATVLHGASFIMDKIYTGDSMIYDLENILDMLNFKLERTKFGGQIVKKNPELCLPVLDIA